MALIALPQAIATPEGTHAAFNYPNLLAHAHTHSTKARKSAYTSQQQQQHYVSPVSAQMFTNPESYPNPNGQARHRVAGVGIGVGGHQQQQLRSRSMAGARHSPPHSGRPAAAAAFGAAAQFDGAAAFRSYPQMSPQAARHHRGRTHARQSSLTLSAPTHVHGGQQAHHVHGAGHRSHSTQMRAAHHHGHAHQQHRASVPHIMYPMSAAAMTDAVRPSTPQLQQQQQQMQHAHTQRLKHLAALQQQENQRRARQKRRARGGRGGSVRPTRGVMESVEDAMRGPDQSLSASSSPVEATPKGPMRPQMEVSLGTPYTLSPQGHVSVPTAATTTTVLLPQQREVNPALLKNTTTFFPQHTEMQHKAAMPPSSAHQHGADAALATNGGTAATDVDGGAITPLSASSRKSSIDSVEQRRRCRKSSFASSGSGAGSSVSSSTDRGSRSSASSMDGSSCSGSGDDSAAEDGVRTPPPKSKKSKKKGAKTTSAHKTKYYATPAYQAKPKIEDIPLPSFLKTDPRFNKKAAAAAPKPKKAKAVKKTVVKDDVRANEGFEKIVSEESEAKLQTAKKIEQKPRHASLPGDASLKAAAAAVAATMAQPPMLAQRSQPPPLTTAATAGANGFYRGSGANNVSPPWTPTNAANAPLAASASGPRLPAPMMPAGADAMPRASSLPASPHSMMPMLARGQTDPTAAMPAANAAEPDTTKDLFMAFVNNVRRYRASEAAANAAKASQRQQQQHRIGATAHGGNMGVAPLVPRVHAAHAATLPSPHHQVRARFGAAQPQHKPSLPAHYGGTMANDADYTMPARHHVNAMTYPGGVHARAHDAFDPVKAYAQFRDVDAAAASIDATAATDEQVPPPALPSLAAVVGVASTAAAHDEAAAAEAELPQLPSLASLRL